MTVTRLVWEFTLDGMRLTLGAERWGKRNNLPRRYTPVLWLKPVGCECGPDFRHVAGYCAVQRMPGLPDCRIWEAFRREH